MRSASAMKGPRAAWVLLCCLGSCAAQFSGHKWGFLGPYNVTPTGLIQEYGYTDTDNVHAAALSGNTRAYLAQNYRAKNWFESAYVRFDMRGRTMSFTVDVSKVPCGVLATLYLVAMGDTNGGPNYCDITPKMGSCTEVDIMEANRFAYQATVHTRKGEEADGTCNVKGCWSNIGKYPFAMTGEKASDLYGPGGRINTDKPFTVVASFGDGGDMTVILQQEFETLTVFNSTLPGNVPDVEKADWEDFAKYPRPQGVPDDASAVMGDMFGKVGGVMVTTLWTAKDTTWLDGGSCGDRKRGQIKGAQVTIKDFSVNGAPPPTTSTHTTSTVTTSTFTIPHHKAAPPPPAAIAAQLKTHGPPLSVTPRPVGGAVSVTPRPVGGAVSVTPRPVSASVHKPPPVPAHKPPPPPISGLYVAEGGASASGGAPGRGGAWTALSLVAAAAAAVGAAAFACFAYAVARRSRPGPRQLAAQREFLSVEAPDQAEFLE